MYAGAPVMRAARVAVPVTRASEALLEDRFVHLASRDTACITMGSRRAGRVLTFG